MTIFDLIIVDGELIEIKKRDKGKPLAGKDERTAIEFIELCCDDEWPNAN